MHRTPRILRTVATATVVVAALTLATPVASGVAAWDVAGSGSWTDERTLFVGRSRPEPVLDDRRPERPEPADRDHAEPSEPVAEPPREDRSSPRPRRSVLVRVPDGGLEARRRPSADAPVVGRVADRSRFYGVPITAWVEEISRDGAWGRIELPYVWPRRNGWVRLDGLDAATTRLKVVVDRSAHRLTLRKDGRVIFRTSAATGRPSSPTPLGEYFVTDRVSFDGGSYGTFAFGLSGIQPRLPLGWSSGDQLAIHGTSSPATIGTSASAGCLRVSEAALARLKPLLQLGTPVIVVR